MSLMYPMLFKPVYDNEEWGSNLINLLGRDISDASQPVAKSWELSDRTGHISVVENGSFQGMTLDKLCDDFGSDLIGNRYRPGMAFPLLIKINSVAKRIPMQVGPDDVACREMGKGEPNTKMWYVLDHVSGAQIFAGLKLTATKQNFLTRLNSSALEDVVQCTLSRKGDAYFIPGGRIHAIGDGNLVYEIQQNSLTDYRFYDWGLASDNEISETELADAIEAIHFTDRMQPRIAGDTSSIVRNKRNL
ncbi:MAG: type I phosphomannose isomerase catalytic subunit, partial [Lentisphaeria bacterium]